MVTRKTATPRTSQTPPGAIVPKEVIPAVKGAIFRDGFSIRTSGRGIGRPARNVLSTGFAPEQGRGAEEAIGGTSSVGSQILGFNRRNRMALSNRKASMVQGGWLDVSTGKVMQDVSVATPKSRMGMEAAMQMASYGSQMSVGNVGPSEKKAYLGDIKLPEDLRRSTAFDTGSTEHWGLSEFGDPDVSVAMRPNAVNGRLTRTTVINPSFKEMASVQAGIETERYGFPDTDQYTRTPKTAEEYLASAPKRRR